MNKEEQMLQKRLLELSSIAYQRDIVTFSDFLNLNELHILQSIPKNELSSRYELFGGYEYAERQMVAFLPDALCYEYEYPIEVLRVSAVHKKYAESLTHRDYLGALLNLGIERSKIGDLAVTDDACLIFCHADMSDFICKEFTRVRHTLVSVERMQLSEFHYVPERTEIKGNVSSIRLDTVLSSAFPISRSKLVGYIEGGKVFVNGKMITSNGYRLKENDIISVRGMGRIQYDGIISETKKERYFIRLFKY